MKKLFLQYGLCFALVVRIFLLPPIAAILRPFSGRVSHRAISDLTKSLGHTVRQDVAVAVWVATEQQSLCAHTASAKARDGAVVEGIGVPD